jgi:hypothetical protein
MSVSSIAARATGRDAFARNCSSQWVAAKVEAA